MRTKHNALKANGYNTLRIQDNIMTHLLQILKDHIHSVPTAPFTTDWQTLISYSKQHEVAAIVYHKCKAFIPEPYLSEMHSLYSSVMFFYANRQRLMEKIESSLSDIQHFTIKGAAVAAFYPFPAFRTMGDTDNCGSHRG